MNLPIALLTVLVAALVVRFLSGPLLARMRERETSPAVSGDAASEASAARHADDLQALEAAREAKYREIRDSELDFRTGKLAREDYEAIDAQLRAEALEILDRLERVRRAVQGEAGGSSDGTGGRHDGAGGPSDGTGGRHQRADAPTEEAGGPSA